MRDNNGFTLIELVMIIVILGILAAVAIPKYFDLQNEAKQSAEKGVVGGVRAGIHTYYAGSSPHTWPSSLDSASDGACNKDNACFTTVLAQGGVTSDWTKAGAVYTGPAGGAYTYTAATGEFTE